MDPREVADHHRVSQRLLRDLVAVLEAIYAGDIVISDLPVRARSIGGLNRPGQSEGLTDRESEILRWSRLVGGRGSGCSG